jgi:preprotein translocase subunit SecA
VNPDQFSTNNQPIPEDVIEDQRQRDAQRREELRKAMEVTPEDLDAEAEEIVQRLRERASKAATSAVKQRVTVSVSERGRVRRNGPCPCGSGAKFKKCCLPEVKDPESEKELPAPVAMRAYLRNQKP